MKFIIVKNINISILSISLYKVTKGKKIKIANFLVRAFDHIFFGSHIYDNLHMNTSLYHKIFFEF